MSECKKYTKINTTQCQNPEEVVLYSSSSSFVTNTHTKIKIQLTMQLQTSSIHLLNCVCASVCVCVGVVFKCVRASVSVQVCVYSKWNIHKSSCGHYA